MDLVQILETLSPSCKWTLSKSRDAVLHLAAGWAFQHVVQHVALMCDLSVSASLRTLFRSQRVHAGRPCQKFKDLGYDMALHVGGRCVYVSVIIMHQHLYIVTLYHDVLGDQRRSVL